MLTLFHDVPSAGSLVAVLRLQRLADEGFDVRFRGIDVVGVEVTLPATLDDLEDWQAHGDEAADLGWELPRPRRHPATLGVHLVAELARRDDLEASWRLAAYRAHWLEGLDLGDREVLVELADRAGLDAGEVAATVADARLRQQLRQQMLAHRGEGIGGVPVLDANGTFLSPFQTDEDLRTLAGL